jgi:hypothetical protein
VTALRRSVALLVLLTPAPAGSAPLDVAGFARLEPGAALPSGWRPLAFTATGPSTDYAIVRDGDAAALRAASHAAGSGLIRPVHVDLATHPVLRWRWKVAGTVADADLTDRRRDDAAARVIVTYAYEPAKLGLLRRAEYQAIRLVAGDVPPAILMYVWDGRLPAGRRFDSPHAGFLKVVVARGAGDRTGAWADEEHDVAADYRRAFGGEPPAVTGIGVLTDTDDTRGSVIAWYGGLLFAAAP